MSMNIIKSQLIESFKNKEARDLFVSQNTGTIISAQVFSMRDKREWTQEELAQRVDMAQARISVLENPNYENFSIKTLKRLASAFDVGLMVRFVSFGELADWVSNLSPEDLAVPDFEHESLSIAILERSGEQIKPFQMTQEDFENATNNSKVMNQAPDRSVHKHLIAEPKVPDSLVQVER